MRSLVIVAQFVLAPIPLQAAPAGVKTEPQQIQWGDLCIVLDKTVSVMMAEGEVVTGTAIGLDPEGLLLKEDHEPARLPQGWPARAPNRAPHFAGSGVPQRIEKGYAGSPVRGGRFPGVATRRRRRGRTRQIGGAQVDDPRNRR